MLLDQCGKPIETHKIPISSPDLGARFFRGLYNRNIMELIDKVTYPMIVDYAGNPIEREPGPCSDTVQIRKIPGVKGG